MGGAEVSVTVKYHPAVLKLLEDLQEPFSNERRAEIIQRAFEDVSLEVLQEVALEMEKR